MTLYHLLLRSPDLDFPPAGRVVAKSAGGIHSPQPPDSEPTQGTARAAGEQGLGGLPRPTGKGPLVYWAHSIAAM